MSVSYILYEIAQMERNDLRVERVSVRLPGGSCGGTLHWLAARDALDSPACGLTAQEPIWSSMLSNNADEFVTGQTIGLFNYADGEVADGAAHAGWNLKITGSGGRAGRVQHETISVLTNAA